MSEYVRLFRVLSGEETRLDTDSDVLGWGVEFPSGLCYVDWNRLAFEEGDRLDNPHVSQYGSQDDVEQGTGGIVQPLFSFQIDRATGDGS